MERKPKCGGARHMIRGRCSSDRRNSNCKALVRTVSENREVRTSTVRAQLGQEPPLRVLVGMRLGGQCDWPCFKHSRMSGRGATAQG